MWTAANSSGRWWFGGRSRKTDAQITFNTSEHLSADDLAAWQFRRNNSKLVKRFVCPTVVIIGQMSNNAYSISYFTPYCFSCGNLAVIRFMAANHNRYSIDIQKWTIGFIGSQPMARHSHDHFLCCIRMGMGLDIFINVSDCSDCLLLPHRHRQASSVWHGRDDI